MKSFSFIFLMAFVLCQNSLAQENSLDRDEVSGIKKKLQSVQKGLGADPDGYARDSEEFSLPTDFNPAEKGKFWPITCSVSLRFSDKSVKDSTANAKKSAEEFQAKYAAAVASGDGEKMAAMMEDMQKMNMAAASAGMNPTKKEQLNVNVQFNMGSGSSIDPDMVVFEKAGVIALKQKNQNDEKGSVTIYLDPVALKETKKLSKIDMTPSNDGMPKKTGVYNITIQINGVLADAEAWAKKMDTAAMLSVIDAR